MNKLDKILKDIEKNNKKIYDNTPHNQKIDFSKSKKNWGTEVIPEEFHINITKKYVTKNGWKVIDLQKVLYSNEKEMTFPIKGTYIEPRKNKKDLRHFCIWTLDGRKMVNNTENHLNLTLVS